MATVNDLIRRQHDYQKTPESGGMQLRLDLTRLIVVKLKEKGWTQKQLAEAAGLKESQVTNLIHANANCTFDTAGRVLHALGIKAALCDADEVAKNAVAVRFGATSFSTTLNANRFAHGTQTHFDRKTFLCHFALKQSLQPVDILPRGGTGAFLEDEPDFADLLGGRGFGQPSGGFEHRPDSVFHRPT